MTTIVAALVAAVVATIGYVLAARAKLLEDRRRTYALALAAVGSYKELPHRIRRRADASTETRKELGTEISNVQRDLDYFAQLLRLDSEALGRSYRGVVLCVWQLGKEYRDHAWEQPPANTDDGMGYDETYKHSDEEDQEWCIRQMRPSAASAIASRPVVTRYNAMLIDVAGVGSRPGQRKAAVTP
jgi:hypothetical protein